MKKKIHDIFEVKLQAFPDGSAGKESTRNAGDKGDMCSIPRLGRSPGVGNGNPLHYILSRESHGQRSLVGFSA